MMNLSIGKLRGLQQCSTPNSAFSILALDHRGNLRNALNPQDPSSVSDQELTGFKIEVISCLAPNASAVLLDVEYGSSQCIASGALPGRIGLLTSLEATGYVGDPLARSSRVLSGWSAAKARRLGASAAKLLVYYHPDSPNAPAMEALVKQVAEECAQNDLFLFVEPLSYSLDPSRKKLPPEERKRVVLETARRLTIMGVDALKAEFPLDIDAETDERGWMAACTELSTASAVPWVLLSASVPYEVFLRQVVIACQSGASGVAVGRAVWQEATGLSAGPARRAFLTGVAHRRMARITSLVDAIARPWTDFYHAEIPGSKWYEAY